MKTLAAPALLAAPVSLEWVDMQAARCVPLGNSVLGAARLPAVIARQGLSRHKAPSHVAQLTAVIGQ